MKYFMNSDENYKQSSKYKKDKEGYFYDLWKDMDPTPDTEHNELMDEYYKRVSYANENFDGWKEGWETDRGMIYILLVPLIKLSAPTLQWLTRLFIKYGHIIKLTSNLYLRIKMVLEILDWIHLLTDLVLDNFDIKNKMST